MDPYSILEVDKTSSQDEIKKAYRRLAKKHHPDKNGGDDVRFKEIAEAYEKVGDESARQQFDATNNFQNFNGFDGRVNMSDVFDHMFGNAFNNKQSAKGLDLRLDLHLSFDEAYSGTSKQFKVNGQELKVDFKPGLKTGMKLRVPGKGQPHQYNSTLPSGDLIINIHVMYRPDWILQGNDIWLELNLPWFDIFLGTKISMNTPEGQIYINVPRNSYPGKSLRIKDRGYPIYGTDNKGALLCKLNAVYNELNEEQLEYIEKVQQVKHE
jgi:curved DNA-binding protein|tara:strand:+ start:19 stop:819 length:801 start_codon:yes stop_codon:yes gene_type:complete